MKKLFVAMMLLCLTLTTHVQVNAQSEEDVYVSYTRNGLELVVEIMSNGNAVDGLSQITYDPAYLTYVDSEKAECVDMSAVNDMESGLIKVDYIADEGMEGVVYSFHFQINEEYKDDEISFDVEQSVHDENGNELSSENGTVIVSAGDKDNQPDPDPEDKPDGETPPTGDNTNTTALFAVLGVSGVLIAAYVIRKRKVHD